jgi:hypothetical protein
VADTRKGRVDDPPALVLLGNHLVVRGGGL